MPSKISVSASGWNRPTRIEFSMNCRQRSMVGSSGTSCPQLEYSRNVLPMGLSTVKLRNTSPQAQWKKFGIVPKILPWVPLPEPGAPNKRMARYFIIQSSVFMLELDLLNFDEGDDHLLRSVLFLHLQVQFVGRNARDSLPDVRAPRGADAQLHVSVRALADDPKKARHLGFEKAPIEGVLSAGKRFCGWQRRRSRSGRRSRVCFHGRLALADRNLRGFGGGRAGGFSILFAGRFPFLDLLHLAALNGRWKAQEKDGT